MGIGTLAHTVGRLPLEELTERLKGSGIDFVQLALSKAIADIDTGPGRLSPGLANAIAERFARAGIRIGVLGCYINPVHPDPERRRLEIARFKEHLRFARDFGAPIVATETGDLRTFAGADPERYEELGWEALRRSAEELAEEAEKRGVFVGIEPAAPHTLSTPDKAARLLTEVPSPNVGIVLDPVNLLSPDNFGEQDAVVNRAFELLGDRIVLAHLKDAQPGGDGRLLQVPAGGGAFRTERFLRKLQAHKPLVDISLECLTGETIGPAVQRVKAMTAAL
ncbi:sugar phosphate isomerase/epimerase family protein [Paenibacillus humicola]|uniref:sugar phosphate isomerase/epimerase family protein n=1 Tax=Paenibacillus humicola TaxID=3110540 RepID=UPI00237C2685|nr:sugar phosphate isomerase/epimerase [Paenibacillus humicola]